MKYLNAFFDEVMSKREAIGISRTSAWYRGHRHGDYNLVPSLFRGVGPRNIEENLYSMFNTKGSAHLPRNVSSWEQLAIMQHFKTPTRLLDWTESLLVAVYFAISYKPNKPHIWILNPYKLNKLSTGFQGIYDDVDYIGFDYNEGLRKDGGWPLEKPISMAPPWTRHNIRIQFQKGCFTCHGNDQRPLDHVVRNCARRIKLSEELIVELRQLLEMASIDQYSMFPDLEGLSLSLRELYQISW